ncbi:MAG: helix-turn-helix transcriptional regulator [Acidimicrobiales bacterium]
MGAGEDPASAALGRREWAEAHLLLSERADERELSIDELDWLATAAYLTGREAEAVDRWTTAHRACLERGDLRRAARFGLDLASVFGFKGDIGRASGWGERVRRVLDDLDADCVEHGYLAFVNGMSRIFEDGDIAGAHTCFTRAAKLADRYRDPELRALAAIGQGRCLIYLGELAEGLALLDEAMVSVEADELSPVVAGDAYCTVIDACHELFDLRRCEAWAESFTRWCDAQPDLVLYRGHCLLHRAEVLHLHGRWEEAVEAAHEACRRLVEPLNLLAIGGAEYLAAELHRLRGEAAAAEQRYVQAHQHGCDPQPGLALLRFAQGAGDAAAAALQRSLVETGDPIGRARLLGAWIEVALTVDGDGARAAVEELSTVASELRSPMLRAQADQMGAAVLLAGGDPGAALTSLHRAVASWTELDVPYELARTRMLVAAARAAVGDAEGGAMERRSAIATFEQLGATDALRRARAEGEAGETPAPAGLTGRELEVLQLVASGSSSREIAAALFISEKTVTSHLTHIFTKLGVSSRSAAAAFAHRHGLA